MGYIMNLRRHVGHQTLLMPCACLIITDGQGRVLLQRRADDGKWGYHGGAVEIDESVQDAVRREVREELNLEVGEMRLFGVYSGASYHHIYPNGDEVSCIDIVYVSSDFRGELRLQEDEVAEVGWFTLDTLPGNMSDNPRQPILDFLHGVQGNTRGAPGGGNPCGNG